MWVASFTPPLEGALSAAGPMTNPDLVREVCPVAPVSMPLLAPVPQHRPCFAREPPKIQRLSPHCMSLWASFILC